MRSEERQTETDNAALTNENTDASPALRKEGYESQTKCLESTKGGCNADSLLGRLTIDGLPQKPGANPRDAEGRAEGPSEGSDPGTGGKRGASAGLDNQRSGLPHAELEDKPSAVFEADKDSPASPKSEADGDEAAEHGAKSESVEDEEAEHDPESNEDEESEHDPESNEDEEAEHDEKPEASAEQGEEEGEGEEEEDENEDGDGEHEGKPEASDQNQNEDNEGTDSETEQTDNSAKGMAGEMAKLAHLDEGVNHDSLKQEQNNEQDPIDDPEDNPDGTVPDQQKDQTETMDAKNGSNTKSGQPGEKQLAKEAASKSGDNSNDCLKMDPGDLQFTVYPESKLQAIKERSFTEVMKALNQAGAEVRNQFEALPLNKDGIGYGQQHIVFLRQHGLNDAAQSMSTHIAALGRIAYGQSMFEAPKPTPGRKPPVDSSTRTWTVPETKPEIIQYKR